MLTEPEMNCDRIQPVLLCKPHGRSLVLRLSKIHILEGSFYLNVLTGANGVTFNKVTLTIIYIYGYYEVKKK